MVTDSKTIEKKPLDHLFKSKNGLSNLPRAGEIVEGVAIEKRGGRLYIDLGMKGTGVIFGREYYEGQELIKDVKPGDSVTAKIIDPDNEEGYVELSVKEAGREKNWDDMKKIMESGETLALKVGEVNRGGLVLEYRGVKGFLPVSQLSSKNYPRVPGGDKEKIFEELKKFLNKELSVKIIDINQQEEKLIFSEKSNESAVIREKLSKYKVGDVISGTVTGLVHFGAFVTFDEELEGLVHISEIDWQLIESPADVLTAGQAVEAKIIDIAGDKVALSLKALKEDPWAKVPERYKKGDVVRGVVVKFNTFGAFIKLDNEIQGLLHISEFGNEARMKEDVVLNQEYEFKILSLDPREHRMGLGLLKNHPEKPETASVSQESVSPDGVESSAEGAADEADAGTEKPSENSEIGENAEGPKTE